MVVIAPRIGQWKNCRSVSREELLKQTLIRREPGSAVRAAFDQLIGKTKLGPGRIIEIGSREGVVSAVAEGLGVAAIFDEGLVPEDRVVKLKIARHNIRSKVEVICLAERRRNQVIDGFLSIASEIAGGHQR
jgi:DNA-binding transcriptional LysR family regulator